MNHDEFESVCISIDDDTATVHRADGAVVDLPFDVVHRSSLLRNAISEANNADPLSLSIPQGVLDAWLDGLKDLGVHIPSPESKLGHRLPGTYTGARKYIDPLKAADFLDDKGAVVMLCAKTCHRLFAPYIETGEHSIDQELAQELLELPRALRLSVLAAQSPVLMQLQLLPQTLKYDALHAAFPSITADSSLMVPYGGYPNELVEPFWASVSALTGLTSLRCISKQLLPEDPHGPHSLLKALGKLPNLVSLSLTELPLADCCLTDVVRAMVCQGTLQKLALYSMRLKSDKHDASELASCLSHFTVLTRLALTDTRLGTDDIRVLAPSIAQLTNLKDIDLSGCKLVTEGSAHVEQILHNCTELTSFCFSRNQANASIIRSLICCTHLQELELPSIPQPVTYRNLCAMLGGVGAQFELSEFATFAKDIAKLTNLRKIQFPGSAVLDEELREFPALFTSLTSLQQLIIHHSEMLDSPKFLTALLTSLPGLKYVTILRSPPPLAAVARADLEPYAVTLASSMATLTALRRISLQDVDLALAGTKALVACLKDATGLESLHLIECNLSNSGARLLAVPLAAMQCMTSLDLSKNRLGDKGIAALADSVGNLSKLQNLCLEHNLYIAEGLAAIAAQFPRLTGLLRLRVGTTKRSSGSASVLAPHMGCLTNLKLLNLEHLHVSSEQFAALAPAIAELTALTCLCLGGNLLACSDIEMMCSSILPSLSALQSLALVGNRIGDKGARLLARSVRVHPSLHVVVAKNELSEECISDLSACPYLAMNMAGLMIAQKSACV